MKMQSVKLINGPHHNKAHMAESSHPSINITSEDGECVHCYVRSGLSSFTFVETISAENHVSKMTPRPVKKCECGYELIEHTCVRHIRTFMAKCRCPQCGGDADHYMYIEKRNLPDVD